MKECVFPRKNTPRWEQQSPPKSLYTHTRPHGVTVKKKQYFNLLWSDVTEIKFRCKQLEGEDSSVLSLKTIGNRRHIGTSKPMTRNWAGHLLSMACEEFVIGLDRKT